MSEFESHEHADPSVNPEKLQAIHEWLAGKNLIDGTTEPAVNAVFDWIDTLPSIAENAQAGAERYRQERLVCSTGDMALLRAFLTDASGEEIDQITDSLGLKRGQRTRGIVFSKLNKYFQLTHKDTTNFEHDPNEILDLDDTIRKLAVDKRINISHAQGLMVGFSKAVVANGASNKGIRDTVLLAFGDILKRMGASNADASHLPYILTSYVGVLEQDERKNGVNFQYRTEYDRQIERLREHAYPNEDGDVAKPLIESTIAHELNDLYPFSL